MVFDERIRRMFENEGDHLLRGIIEADENYIGRKPPKKVQFSKRDNDDNQPKGRGGSRKMMVVTSVERGGEARSSFPS